MTESILNYERCLSEGRKCWDLRSEQLVDVEVVEVGVSDSGQVVLGGGRELESTCDCHHTTHSMPVCPQAQQKTAVGRPGLSGLKYFSPVSSPPSPSPSFPPEDQPIWPPSWPAALLASLNTCIENNKAREQNISQLTGRRSVFVVEAWNFIWSSHLVTPDLSYLLSLSLSRLSDSDRLLMAPPA